MTSTGSIADRFSPRRQAVLQSAFEAFSARTIEEVSMTDIAAACGLGVATLYRHFGTKLRLVIETAAMKWHEFSDEMDVNYRARGGLSMSAMEEYAFFLDTYIDLYANHQALLRFDANFDLFILHQHAEHRDLDDYYASVQRFAAKFATIAQKARADGTLNAAMMTDELYYSIMYTMLSTAQRFACGVLHPAGGMVMCMRIMHQQKEMFIRLVQPQPAE